MNQLVILTTNFVSNSTGSTKPAVMSSLRFCGRLFPFHFPHPHNLKKCFFINSNTAKISSKKLALSILPSYFSKPIYHGQKLHAVAYSSSSQSSTFSGVEDVVMEYVLGKTRATEVAHSVWKDIVKNGDIVIDATCGNGHDTLALLKLVTDGSGNGRVYAMDIQEVALKNTSSLLDATVNPDEKALVKLLPVCHSKIGEIVLGESSVRLVAFNLGYLPGGDKANITRTETTVLALEASKKVLASGGLISIVAYVGHPGGREEFEAVECFISELSAENWTCTKLQKLNQPLAPVLLFVFKK